MKKSVQEKEGNVKYNKIVGLIALGFAAYLFTDYLFVVADLSILFFRYVGMPIFALWIIASAVTKRKYKKNQSEVKSLLAKPLSEQLQKINKEYPAVFWSFLTLFALITIKALVKGGVLLMLFVIMQVMAFKLSTYLAGKIRGGVKKSWAFIKSCGVEN